jgi:hypothetical protein
VKINRNEEDATLAFVPTGTSEVEVVTAILAIVTPGEKLSYAGRNDATETEKFSIELYAGATKEPSSETSGNVTVVGIAHVGGVRLDLRGDTDDDDLEVRRLRDTCYFGSGGLIFLGETEVDGRKALLITAAKCKLCEGNMLGLGECEWKTCNACKDKCEHVYIRGLVHGGGAGGVGMGEYCEKCGRCKPLDEGERPKSQIEHHLAVERELGVHVMYKEGPLTTPTEVVQAARLVRGYRRSRARAQTS